MAVTIEGRYTFDLPIQVVYDALRDENLIREALPGRVKFDMTSPTHYEASMTLDIPRFGGFYEGELDVVATEEPYYYDLVVQGSGLGRHVTASGRVALATTGYEQTEVHFKGETDAFDSYNRWVQMAAPPIAAAFASRGLDHLHKVIQRRQKQ